MCFSSVLGSLSFTAFVIGIAVIEFLESHLNSGHWTLDPLQFDSPTPGWAIPRVKRPEAPWHAATTGEAP